MQLKNHVCLMAKYNQAMNQNLYEIAKGLSPEQLLHDSGAFFGSIWGTLNHIAVGDTIWLKRISPFLTSNEALSAIEALPQPTALDAVICTDLAELSERRALLDDAICRMAQAITDEELDRPVKYHNMKGQPFSKQLFSLLMHLFNHQTHHRGQVTTLLSQMGVEYGVTDLLVSIPES